MQAQFEQYRYTVIKEMKKKEKKELGQIPKRDQHDLKKQIEHCKALTRKTLTRNRRTNKISTLNEHMSYNIQKYTQQFEKNDHRTVLEQRQRPDDDAYIKQKVAESHSNLNCLEQLEQLLVVKLKQHHVVEEQMLAVKSRLQISPNDIWTSVRELNKSIEKLKQADKHQEATQEQQILNDRVLFNTVWNKQSSLQEEINKLKQDVKWATSIYNDQTIRKYIFKILRKGYLLKKMEEMCNDFEKTKYKNVYKNTTKI